MDTKTRQSEAHSSTQLTCKYCEQPIMPGPDFIFESQACAHRRCFRHDVHQDWVVSQAHEIWATIFVRLFIGLHQSRDELKRLFEEYRVLPTIPQYLECLRNSLDLIKRSSLSEDNKFILTDQVNDALAAIKRLNADGVN